MSTDVKANRIGFDYAPSGSTLATVDYDSSTGNTTITRGGTNLVIPGEEGATWLRNVLSEILEEGEFPTP